ncbi:MAG TPA: TonB-dependent receptor [Caulobacteraceae bacterium]|jgi:iron complex outermembrane receptor protein|nr:TonB-dependent receptor [Caulobacteraceae bacterium]
MPQLGLKRLTDRRSPIAAGLHSQAGAEEPAQCLAIKTHHATQFGGVVRAPFGSKPMADSKKGTAAAWEGIFMSDGSRMRSVLISGVSIVALTAVAAPALAQTPQPAAPAPGAAPASPSADEGGAQDVIVTAEHRQTKLQKVPVAVSVFTGASRDRVGIQSVQDVTNFTPGFSYDTVTVNAGMRGVTRQSFNVTDDSRVTAYEDEFFVYSPYNLGLSSLFFSQEQIERGPQNVGGRPSEGGSIDMIAVRPTDHPYAEVRASVGNFQSYEVEAAASDEIAPGLTARIAGNYDYQGQGYFNNVAGGGPSEFNRHNQWHLEGSVDWKPSPNFDVYARAFAGEWNVDEGNAGSRQFYSAGSWDEVNLNDPNVGAADGSLFFNPNYGYAGIVPAAAAGAAAVGAAQFAAGGFPQELPIATTLLNQHIFNNPSINNVDNFAAVEPRTAELQHYNDLNYILTYHFPNADLKYTGGVQGYNYTLNYADVDSDVLSYTLPGSAFGAQATALAGLGPLAPAFAGLPAPSTLTINPTDNINFVENDWWTSHEISLQSTDASPFQYIVGAQYYFQQYSQPSFVTANQPQLAHPLSASSIDLTSLTTTLLSLTPSVVLNPANRAAANPRDVLVENNYQIQDQSVSGYAQVSYKLTDTLKLTGNLRVSNDRKWGSEEDRDVAFGGSSLASLYNILIPLYGGATPSYDVTGLAVCLSGISAHCTSGPLAPGVKSIGVIRANGVANRQLDASDTEVTGGAGIEWTPTPDIFMYARYARGYAPLSFNAGFVSANPEVTPEFLNSYEVGYKQSFGHTLSIDVAAYYYDYDQIQLPITVAVNGILEGQFINYPKAESTGVELEGIWNPTRDLLFTLSYSFDYTELLTGCSGTLSAGVLTPSAGSACLVNTQDPAGTGPGARVVPGQVYNATTNPGVFQSIKGAPLPNAPRNKVAVTGAYTFHFDPGNLTMAATYVWRDSQIGNTVFNTPYNTAPSWDDVDLRATWSGDHDRYEIIAYAKNVFNSLQYPTGALGAGLTGNGTTGTSAAARLIYDTTYNLNPPRTFGVEVRYKFF